MAPAAATPPAVRFAPALAIAPSLRASFERLLRAPVSGLLIAGPGGAGKDTLARAYGRALSCTATGARPCERCGGCRAADLAWLDLDDTSKASIGIEAATAVRDLVHERSVVDAVLVVQVHGADRLTAPAANLLLKTLEEPPAHVRFVLTAAAPDRVLATIRSRCQLVRAGSVPADEIARIFDAPLAAAPGGELMRSEARGLPGRLARFIADTESWQAHLALRDTALAALRGDTVARIGIAAAASKSGSEDALLDRLALLLGDAICDAPGSTVSAAAAARSLHALLRARRLLGPGISRQLVLENALLALPG